jgi:streptomycin 6-kinase
LFRVDSLNGEAVLKYALDPQEATFGVEFLKSVSGHGGIPFFEVDEESGTVLMERAVPGLDLHAAVSDDEEAVRIAAGAIKGFRQAEPVRGGSLAPWFRQLGDASAATGDPRVGRALAVYEWLEVTTIRRRSLHADLHHFNLLSHGDGWVVIDPKGYEADPAYECSAFFRNPYPFIGQDPLARQKTETRIDLFADELGDDPSRIWGWAFSQLTLDALEGSDFGVGTGKIAAILEEIGLERGYWD